MIVEPTKEHEAYLAALKATLANEGANIEGDILACITAQFLGMLIAHLDEEKYTERSAMMMIAKNMEIGNQAAADAAKEDDDE